MKKIKKVVVIERCGVCEFYDKEWCMKLGVNVGTPLASIPENCPLPNMPEGVGYICCSK